MMQIAIGKVSEQLHQKQVRALEALWRAEKEQLEDQHAVVVNNVVVLKKQQLQLQEGNIELKGQVVSLQTELAQSKSLVEATERQIKDITDLEKQTLKPQAAQEDTLKILRANQQDLR